MTYFSDINTYLHQSSQLLQAYPSTTRITTKYSLPRKPKSSYKPENSKSPPPTSAADVPEKRERLPPAATLTLKTFNPGSGICLKYRTDKAAEVGRLMTGLGRLAAGEVIEMPAPITTTATSAPEDKMEVDEPVARVAPVSTGTATPKVEEPKTAGQLVGSGGGKNKKKKGKK